MFLNCLRLFLLFSVFAISRTAVYAQAGIADSTDGYLINNTNDTIYSRIFLGTAFHMNGDDHSFREGVMVRDSNGIKTYVTSDLKGFGLRKRNLAVHYRTIKPDKNYSAYFAKVCVLGGRLTLYYDNEDHIRPSVAGVGSILTGAAASGNYKPFLQTDVDNQYVLQDSAGRLIRIPQAKPSYTNKQLLRFFEGNAEMTGLIKELVSGFDTMREFVRETNLRAKATQATR
jgi:hypothetical protein